MYKVIEFIRFFHNLLSCLGSSSLRDFTFMLRDVVSRVSRRIKIL